MEPNERPIEPAPAESVLPPAQPAPAPSYTPPYRNAVKPAPYAIDRADWILAGVLLFLSIAGVAAGVWGGFFLGYAAAFDLLFLTYSLYFARRHTKINVYPLLCGVLSVALSPVFFLTTDPLVRFLSVCVMAVTSTVWFCALAQRPVPDRELGLAERVLRQYVDSISRIPKSLRSLFQSEDPHVKTFSKLLLGVLCASPVLCAVIALLVRSDAAFEGLMHHLVSDIGSTAAQLILALLLFPCLLSFGFTTKKDTDDVKPRAPFKGLDTTFIAAFIGLLAACYLVYLFSQLAYFFSAFSGILPEGYAFSYADYARRGFFELCGIAAINLAVQYLTLLLCRKKDEKLPLVLRILCTFVSLFTLLLIATAIAKMALYIRQYGVTTLRLGTSAFMVCMAIVFIAMLLRLYISRIRVLPVALAAAAVILLVLGVVNIRAFAARYNYNAYVSGKIEEIDVTYLRQLGDEGVPYLIRLTECSDKDVASQACGELCLAVERLYTGTSEECGVRDDGMAYIYLIPDGKAYNTTTGFSVPRRTAYALLDEFLANNKTFLKDHVEERTNAWDQDPYIGMSMYE